MHASSSDGERTLTGLDVARLRKFVADGRSPDLGDVLDDAQVLAPTAVPPDVVTMNSRFIVRDLRLQRRQVIRVCYPADADATRGCISVLSPAGLALLGLRTGELARWTGPAGEETVAQIEEMLFQPEASGDYAT